MKPSETPCRVRNSSLYFARMSLTRDMSASLNVVRMAAELWASTSRAVNRAMPVTCRSTARTLTSAKSGGFTALPSVPLPYAASLEPAGGWADPERSLT